MKDYHRVRRSGRLDYYRRAVEVGLAVQLSRPDADRLELAAKAEAMAMAIVADLLEERCES